MNKRSLLIIICLLCTLIGHAQVGRLKGFVLDASNGQPISSATIILKDSYRGVATDENGYFLFQRLPVGSVTLVIRSVGYTQRSLTVEIKPDEFTQVLIQINPVTIQLGEATISGTRQHWETTNTVSLYRLTPKTINRIPSITGSPDLGEFLQLIPGIIFTGDQGGQFYVRGGGPIHNLVKIDGMTVVNPFHSIGFVSVFDTETISQVDVYTAGFDARYGGRLSSVIDIRTRPGNRRNLAGSLNVSNFGYGLTLDVPLLKMTTEKPRSISLLVSNKRSYIDQIDDKIYPHLSKHGIPYKYDDLFAKVSFMGIYGDQLDILGMRITDQAWFGETMQSSWTNTAGGARFLTSPSSSQWLYQASSYYSDYRGQFIEADERPRETWFTSFENSMKVFRMGEIAEWHIGLNLDMYNTNHSFQGIDGVKVEREYYTTEVVSYIANKTRLGKWLFEPGLHLVYYADQTFFSPEPRLKIKYSISPSISLNMATGWYSQNLMSTTSDRDVIALFQGFYIGPDLVQDYYKGKLVINKVQQAWHGVLGLSIMTPKNIKLTIEGYYKGFTKLVSYNRNRIHRDSYLTWDIPEYTKSFFLLEEGQAYGLDFLLDYSKDNFSIWLGYSLAYVFREDERIVYLPHYDRRHNLNLLTGYQFGKRKDWNFKARWNLGSGFPFTQTNGVYEDFSMISGTFIMDVTANGDLNAWFGDLNEGRLPWYHRLDISLNKTFEFSHKQKLQCTLGIINVYNRKNMFYINRLSYERIDQYPILPNLSIKYSF
ncbi:MAG: TonB-dependent receptor [Bacteroidota bacterium]|nr:TonB-dependent receptor [Bacteroidota bacterium]